MQRTALRAAADGKRSTVSALIAVAGGTTDEMTGLSRSGDSRKAPTAEMPLVGERFTVVYP